MNLFLLEEGTADIARRGPKPKNSTLEADEGTADTARRSRKRKSNAQEAPEPNNKVARISKAPAPATALVLQMGGTPIVEDEIVPEPWRAPVARMY
jgi:hypothetical protein